MARALLLGGSGFIGTHLAMTLRQQGVEPILWDPRVPKDPTLEHHQAGVTELAQGKGDTVLAGVEALYHLAWTTFPAAADANPARDIHDNLLPGVELLHHLTTLSHPPRLIFISSGGTVYGTPRATPIHETHPTLPIGAYGAGKLAMEHYLELYRQRHGLEILIFRPGNPYGEHQRPGRGQGAVMEFLHRVQQERPIEIWGTGEVVRDYFHVDDLTAALALGMTCTLEQTGTPVFNVGSGSGVSLNALVRQIESVTQKKATVVYRPGRGVDVPCVVLDIDRISTALGWKPVIGLQEGLGRLWANMQKRTVSE